METKVKTNSQEHREGLILLYETQLEDAGKFMTIVLNEAIRKLKKTTLKPTNIENWVVNLEKQWRKI
jgi:hypothetical protein